MTTLHTWVAPNTHWVAVLQSMTASEYYVVSQGRCVRVGEPGSRKASWLADDQGLALKMHLHSKHPSFTQVACLFQKLADANEHCRLSPSFCAPFLSSPISSIQGLSWSFLGTPNIKLRILYFGIYQTQGLNLDSVSCVFLKRPYICSCLEELPVHVNICWTSARSVALGLRKNNIIEILIRITDDSTVVSSKMTAVPTERRKVIILHRLWS